MKVFIVFASFLAVALAGHYSQHYNNYPLHIPVIDHKGVPVESAEIVHARQAHLAHVAAIKSRQHGYENSHIYPSVGHYGIPLDTPEVQAAKAAHFAAYNKAAAAAYDHHNEHYRQRRGIFGFAFPTIGHHGVPIDTPEVQAAKAAHFAAHAKASGLHDNVLGYGNAYHYGVHHYAPLDHNGHVIDTPEVAALKAKHFVAHAAARSRVGAYEYGSGHVEDYEGAYNHGHYYGPYHVPVIGSHGVPVDTPEVIAARQNHLKALAAASSRSTYHH